MATLFNGRGKQMKKLEISIHRDAYNSTETIPNTKFQLSLLNIKPRNNISLKHILAKNQAHDETMKIV